MAEQQDRLTRLEMAVEKMGTDALTVAATAVSRPGCSSNSSNAVAKLTAEEQQPAQR